LSCPPPAFPLLLPLFFPKTVWFLFLSWGKSFFFFRCGPLSFWRTVPHVCFMARCGRPPQRLTSHPPCSFFFFFFFLRDFSEAPQAKRRAPPPSNPLPPFCGADRTSFAGSSSVVEPWGNGNRVQAIGDCFFGSLDERPYPLFSVSLPQLNHFFFWGSFFPFFFFPACFFPRVFLFWLFRFFLWRSRGEPFRR